MPPETNQEHPPTAPEPSEHEFHSPAPTPPEPAAVPPVSPPQPPPTFSTPPQPQAHNPAGLIILQWLTYAFWGWTVFVMSILTATVLSSFLSESDPGEFTAYAVAAVLVLLPISVACDVFYTKQEPQRKTGAASVIMIIHAVIFALFGIAAVIAAVFSVVTLFTSSSDSSGAQASLFSSLIIALLYAATFLRTLAPAKLPGIRRAYVIGMVVVVGIVAIMGLIGPVGNARATRDDRLITDNISQLSEAINDYADQSNQLPESLSALDLDEDAQQLVDKQLVQYKSETSSPSAKSPSVVNSTDGDSLYGDSQGTELRYQLCATYTEASNNRYNASRNEYSTYINTYSHPAGKVCYKLKTTSYNSDY